MPGRAVRSCFPALQSLSRGCTSATSPTQENERPRRRARASLAPEGPRVQQPEEHRRQRVNAVE